MLKSLLENPRALVMAILVHVVLLGVLLVSIDWTSKPDAAQQVQPVKAVVVDETRVQAEMDKLKKAEQKKKADEAARQKKLKSDAEAARKKRLAEEKRIADLKKKKADLAKKAKEEEQRLAAAKKKREEDARKKAEARRKADQARRAKELEEQLAAEQQAAQQAEISRYIALIRNKVSQSWLRPVGFQKGLKCTVQVNLIPSGDVVNAQVTVSSGNPVFDRSVLSAVRKASPLPLPKDPALLNEMRVINFEFEPKA